jgi:hypothetical protein
MTRIIAGVSMPSDKSLFYYGAIYHRLFDPQFARVHQVAVDLIRDGSSVHRVFDEVGTRHGVSLYALGQGTQRCP